jgi:hypothetical protein
MDRARWRWPNGFATTGETAALKSAPGLKPHCGPNPTAASRCSRFEATLVNGLPRGWSSAKGWQSIGEIAGRVVRQCGEDIRDHQIKMRTELNKQAHVAGHTPRTNNPQCPKGFEGGQS